MRILTDEPSGGRDALRPLANGKLLAFGRWLGTVLAAALVAYFTAQLSIENRITRLETQQETFSKEVLRSLDRIEAELVRLRSIK